MEMNGRQTGCHNIRVKYLESKDNFLPNKDATDEIIWSENSKTQKR
jgi:hypothetical protein